MSRGHGAWSRGHGAIINKKLAIAIDNKKISDNQQLSNRK